MKKNVREIKGIEDVSTGDIIEGARGNFLVLSVQKTNQDFITLTQLNEQDNCPFVYNDGLSLKCITFDELKHHVGVKKEYVIELEFQNHKKQNANIKDATCVIDAYRKAIDVAELLCEETRYPVSIKLLAETIF
jgi:hypothetical protein